MRPDRRAGDAERGGYFRNAADLDDRQQYAKLGRRQLEGTADGLRRGRYRQGRLADEQSRSGSIDNSGAAPRSRGQGQRGRCSVRRPFRSAARRSPWCRGPRRPAPRLQRRPARPAIDMRILATSRPPTELRISLAPRSAWPAGIGMNQAPGRIDQIHAGTEPIERIDESRDFRRLELEHSCRSARRASICGAISLICRRAWSSTTPFRSWRKELRKMAGADGRPVDDRAQEIDQALGLRPIDDTIRSRRVRRTTSGRWSRSAVRVVAEKVPFSRPDRSRWKESNRQRRPKSNAVRIDACATPDILAEKSAAGAADKAGDPLDGTLLKRSFNGGVVSSGADQVTSRC